MKTKILFIAAAVLIAVTGCAALKNNQVFDKETVFGLNAETPGASGTTIKLQIGLVRYTFGSNPTSTNKIYAAKFGSVVHADISAAKQIADESIIMGADASAAQDQVALKNLESVPPPTLKTNF